MNSTEEVPTEAEMKAVVRRYPSHQLLLAIGANQRRQGWATPVLPGDSRLPVFVAAALSDFAVRWSNPYRGQQLDEGGFIELVNTAMAFLTNDPIVDLPDGEDASAAELIRMIVRMGVTQFAGHADPLVAFTRPFAMFGECARRVEKLSNAPQFDFDAAYLRANGISLEASIAVGFAVFTQTMNAAGLREDTLEVLGRYSDAVPVGERLRTALEMFAMDGDKAREVHGRLGIKDSELAMYDLPSLYLHPVIRPWASIPTRLVAPVPRAIPARLADGIYMQMHGAHGDSFTRWFGHVFSEYVGDLLKCGGPNERVYSEEEIRQTYGSEAGKVPDWVIRRGEELVLVECKAARLPRASMFNTTAAARFSGYKQTAKALKQVGEFRHALLKRKAGLEEFRGATSIYSVVVTLERMWMLSTNRPSEPIARLEFVPGAEDVPLDFRWEVVALTDLEAHSGTLDDDGAVGLFREMFSKGQRQMPAVARKATSFHHRRFLQFVEDLGISSA